MSYCNGGCGCSRRIVFRDGRLIIAGTLFVGAYIVGDALRRTGAVLDDSITLAIIGIVRRTGEMDAILPVEDAAQLVIAHLLPGLRATARLAAGRRTTGHIACSIIGGAVATIGAGHGVAEGAVAISVAPGWSGCQADVRLISNIPSAINIRSSDRNTTLTYYEPTYLMLTYLTH